MRACDPQIFISYRRADSAVFVDHLYERLVARYGSACVFRDVNDIPYGIDFHDPIAGRLASCDVVLAVIGPDWLGGAGERTRIGEPNDPVRVELEAALAAKATIIPVLIEGADAPKRDGLPESLTQIPSLNAAKIVSGRDFENHFRGLVRGIDAALDARGKFIADFPAWAGRLAIYCAGVTLAATIALATLAYFGLAYPFAAEALIVVASLGLAITVSALAGDALARRRLHLPFRGPVAFAIGVGVLTFALGLGLGTFALPLLQLHDEVHLGSQLLAAYSSARDRLETKGSADFSKASDLVAQLRKLNPKSGYAWYFAGEIKRAVQSVLFTPKSCFKGWPKGQTGSLAAYEEDFYGYREIAMSMPVEALGDQSSAFCYQTKTGYCLQRLYWIDDLLANDFYLEGLALRGKDRTDDLNLAKEYAAEALKYHRPEGGDGFDQCIPTWSLTRRIDAALTHE